MAGHYIRITEPETGEQFIWNDKPFRDIFFASTELYKFQILILKFNLDIKAEIIDVAK